MKRLILTILIVFTFAPSLYAEEFEVLEEANSLVVRFYASDPIQVGRTLKSFLLHKKLIVQEIRSRNFIFNKVTNGPSQLTFPNFFRESDSLAEKQRFLGDIKSHLDKSVPAEPNASTPSSQIIALIRQLTSGVTSNRANREAPLEKYEAQCKQALDEAIDARAPGSHATIWTESCLEQIFPKLEKWAFDTHQVHIRSIDFKSSLVIGYSHTGELKNFLGTACLTSHLPELEAYDELLSNAIGRLVTGNEDFIDIGAYNVCRFPLLILMFTKYEKKGFVLGKEILPLEGRARAVFVVRRAPRRT